MSLTADPQACTVPAAKGASTHKLVNAGAEKLVFKIKSSNNNEYRISPVFGLIDPSGSKDLTITRTAGAPKEDKLLIYFGPAPADATDPQAAFGAITAAGTVTIPFWGKHLWSLDRLAELDDLEEKIKECLKKAFTDENDFEFDDSSRSMSSVSRNSEVRVASIKVEVSVKTEMHLQKTHDSCTLAPEYGTSLFQ
ncbi:hypothetical protein CAEBREN_16391 [Caenorhabditis brenneri]|uniref:Major sperm protein n=1 Tax=Caenorhabditis brenneri TaxID=135651 RepID=G0P5L2_CAEBE|nr:hypothetical protein CAEBREN_16391 [Caenorhabditis brenneri]